MEPAAAAVVPFFISSLARFCVGTGMRPGSPPVMPAKSPSPSMTAGVKRHFDLGHLRLFGIRERLARGIVQGLDAETH